MTAWTGAEPPRQQHQPSTAAPQLDDAVAHHAAVVEDVLGRHQPVADVIGEQPMVTTGAGDAFHAGFIYGMLQGEDVESCLKLGNALAALKCRALGGRSALPAARELSQFLNSLTNNRVAALSEPGPEN